MNYIETSSQESSNNKKNSYISEVLSLSLLSKDDKPSPVIKGNIEKKESTLDKLVQFVEEVPQVVEGNIRYVIIEGWSRELLLQAESIRPVGSAQELDTKLKTAGSEFPILPHGDIDVIWMHPDQIVDIWRKHNLDGGKNTTPVQLLYHEDPSRRQSGNNPPDEGALEKYCCEVEVKGHRFIVPKPEIIFLEYSYHKNETVPWGSLLIELDKKYDFDLGLFDEARSKIYD